MQSFFRKFSRTSTKTKKAKKPQSTFMYIVCAILSKDDSPKPKKENASDLSYLIAMYAPGSVYAKPAPFNKYNHFIPIPNDSIDYDALPTIEESIAAINAKYPDLENLLTSKPPKRSPALSSDSLLTHSTSNSSLMSYASTTSTKVSRKKSIFEGKSSKRNDRSSFTSFTSSLDTSSSSFYSSSTESLPCNYWLDGESSGPYVNYFSFEY